MAHLLVCAPFLMIWLYVPAVRVGLPPESMEKLGAFVPAVCVYIAARTVLAYLHPPRLKWEYVFPPIDVAIVSMLIYLGNRDPLNNVSILYFFPLAEAAGTLSLAWAASVALMVLAGAYLASLGVPIHDVFGTSFRYFMILLMASLLTALARAAAHLREQLAIARDRNRIALEMHDGVQGHLMTIASQLELAQHLAGRDPGRTAEIASESRDTARLAADELRFLVERLRAPSLRSGFLSALKQFAHNQTARNGLPLEFSVSGDPWRLGPASENGLFRIAQEALNNVLRHASACSVRIDLDYGRDVLELCIADDGCGFDGESREGNGLESIRRRAAELSGDVRIESKPGAGTRVSIAIPRRAAEK